MSFNLPDAPMTWAHGSQRHPQFLQPLGSPGFHFVLMKELVVPSRNFQSCAARGHARRVNHAQTHQKASPSPSPSINRYQHTLPQVPMGVPHRNQFLERANLLKGRVLAVLRGAPRHGYAQLSLPLSLPPMHGYAHKFSC